jgi:predicted kinase
VLLVVSGLPGTGKSTVADALASRLAAVRVSVDPLEEALLGSGLPASRETGVAAYRAGGAVAEHNLAIGHVVVADAVNDSEAARNTWRSAAGRAGADVLFVVLGLDDAAEHRRRIETRPATLVHVPMPSWADVLDRASSYEAWAGGDFLGIDAGSPVGEVVEQVLTHLRTG